MNRIFTLAFLLLSVIVFGQAPQLIPYQAIARDAAGQPLSNATINARFTIHDGAATGAVVWQEIQTVSNSPLGLFTVQLGSANSLSNVSWANGSKFMQVEVDFGSGFVDIGTQQMLSVPYALFSGQAENSNFLLDEYISVWNDNATINLLPNKKYFINANNITLILPPYPQYPEGLLDRDNIEVYVMQHEGNPRIITLDWSNSLFAGILNAGNNFIGFGVNQPSAATGHFQTGFNKIVNIGDFWMCAGFRVP
jgi:hypothetical protein